jgi:hypothetical protein
MNGRQAILIGILSVGLFTAPLVAEAQPIIEEFRFDPPRLCFRDTFRWGFSYRGIPGGLAGVKNFELTARWDGPDEQSIRSLLTPTRDDLQRYTADQGRFESRLLHWGAPRKAPGQVRYTARVVLADGRETTSITSVRYVDGCALPSPHTSLKAGPSGRIGFRASTPTLSEFLQGIKPENSTVIWGDLQLPLGPVNGVRPLCSSMAPAEWVHARTVGPTSFTRPAPRRS